MLATTVPRRLSDGRTMSVCTFSLPRNKYRAYYLADLVLFYATPLLTASVLYALMARTLLRRTRPVAHRGSFRRPTGEDETALAAVRDGATTTSDISSNVQVLNAVSWNREQHIPGLVVISLANSDSSQANQASYPQRDGK